MQTINFDDAVEQLVTRDPRYTGDAYHFVREALDHTQKLAVKKAESATPRHVSGQQLLDGIRDYAMEQFGPMAMDVLGEWGVRRCEDFGEIVFNMVEADLLKKTAKDSRADFQGGYTFEEAFRQPFLPRGRLAGNAAAEGRFN
jgi:uncharacterized repeat protein (TIGR04138 family)